jgi:hypothetical protein
VERNISAINTEYTVVYWIQVHSGEKHGCSFIITLISMQILNSLEVCKHLQASKILDVLESVEQTQYQSSKNTTLHINEITFTARRAE